ncbi:MAG: Glu-tRNA(Gln) amidotransferase subunit GatD [Methanosarcinaceae archaeon]|nr:Glu-tRNA(Gln) amidotransferase subunit GatD [Methanosarcinaceae archaeon]
MDLEQGDRIRIEKNDEVYEGVVMPSTTKHVVIKMVSGYNAGIDPDGATITLLGKNKMKTRAGTTHKTKRKNDLPKVSILSTGGTIASKIDYRTGAVTAQFSADDIVNAIPELTSIANISGKAIYNVLSENMKAEYWIELAGAIAEEINNGADGIIVAHGTDTMMYSAAALAFMLKTPVPIVFVGSQRSADRPSSDNAMNAIAAVRVAVSDIAEVCVVMHSTTSDDHCDIHYATKVRKMHTSRRDAFHSINSTPIGHVEHPDGKIVTTLDHAKRGNCELQLANTLQLDCALVKYTPGASSDILSYYIDSGYKGIVIEGTGLGHVSTDWIPTIKHAVQSGIPVIMTSQCLSGRICDRVYDTGKDIMEAGAIEGEDMLPEVALVKLMWILGQTQDMNEIRKLMETNICHEITERSLQ